MLSIWKAAKMAYENSKHPAPKLELTNQEGEAEQKEETTKVKYRKGKKALKITKDNTTATGAGRNVV